MLHAAFWHHGASDLSLPGWWAATSAYDGGSGDFENRPAGNTSPTASSSSGGVLLDFLYPEKTLALLRQLSTARPDTSSPRRRRLHGPSVRNYSTLELQRVNDETSAETTRPQQEKKELAAASRDPQAPQKLRAFLRLQESSGQDYAWQLYTAIPASQLADQELWTLQADLLEYLAVDDDPAVPRQVLQLFEELPEEYRRLSSYRAAIAAYISLRMVGPAMQLLDTIPAQQDFDFSLVGVDLVLRRTILDEQWDLSLRVFRMFLTQKPTLGKVSTSTSIQWGNRVPEVWKGVATLHRLPDYLKSFLNHVREFQHDLNADEQKAETLSLFAMTFVPHVMDQVLQDETLTIRPIVRFFRQLFKILERVDIPRSVCYEHALRLLMKVTTHPYLSELALLRADLYKQHRQLCLESTKPSMESVLTHSRIRPSLHLLRNLVILHCDRDQLAQANDVLQDHRIFYPEEPLRAGLLEYLVHFFADHGDLTRTEEYLTQLKTHYKDEVNLKLLSALPFACARRADVVGAIVQFNRIRDEFGLVQDTACWNILLLAYVRADDLDGALECFNTLMANDIQPDKITFGTLLDLCAQRGDVEAFEALFSRSEQMGIDLTSDTRARSGYVQVFLRAGDAQGAEAIAQGMLQNWQAGTLRGHTLTHTWNLLIQHHALHGDIASARDRYREMVDNNIPLDTWTYGSLMRALVQVKQSNAAYKILTRTLPRLGLRDHALHYAIVLTGLLREGGGQLELAIRTYKIMQERGIAQTVSSQLASISTLGTSELRELGGKRTRHRNYRLKDVDEAVENMVAAAVQGQAVYREPQHMRQLDSRNFGAPPQAFYGLLISLYTQRGAYKVCQKLIQKAEQLKPDAENYTTPLTLITGTMEAHLKAGEHAEIRELWLLARESAKKMTKTVAQAATPELPAPESDDLLDPSIRESYAESYISPNRRQILVRAARLYVRSLFDPSNPRKQALNLAKRTLRELLVEGYVVDGFTWNELVATLAQRGRLVDAFDICEEYLMPSFPGWRNLHPNYIRRDRKGYTWMELRHHEIRRDSIMPRYKTLIVLAAEYRQVKADERNGIGFNQAEGMWQAQVLENKAPMVVRAIETMPRTNDKLQKDFFHNEL